MRKPPKKKMNKAFCGQCGKHFLTRKDRRIHQQRDHREENPRPDKPFVPLTPVEALYAS